MWLQSSFDKEFTGGIKLVCCGQLNKNRLNTMRRSNRYYRRRRRVEIEQAMAQLHNELAELSLESAEEEDEEFQDAAEEVSINSESTNEVTPLRPARRSTSPQSDPPTWRAPQSTAEAEARKDEPKSTAAAESKPKPILWKGDRVRITVSDKFFGRTGTLVGKRGEMYWDICLDQLPKETMTKMIYKMPSSFRCID